ncbi:MAG: Tryptophan synthase beta chain like protein [Myxococcaceae bacterium]|nr:Tryptophan synthase beta chain like protein [Myxococcaceae bacterium]
MSSPRALPAPTEPVVSMTRALAEQALAASRASDRKRVILPFHKSAEDRLHRMFNAMQPGTYARPHRHKSPAKSEVFLVLRGALDFVVFGDDGAVEQVRRLEAGSETFGIDLSPGIFHGLVVRAPDTLIYEVKDGPYTATDDKDFASWAPEENTPEVTAYLTQLDQAIAHWTSRASRARST